MLKYLRLNPLAIPPTKKEKSDAGWDLYSLEDRVLKHGERHTFMIGLAIRVETEIPHYLRIAPRSGMAKEHGIHVLGGVVDMNYSKEIGVILVNLGFMQDSVPTHNSYTVKKGDKIAQIIPELLLSTSECEEIFSISKSRGDGFGSSGR